MNQEASNYSSQVFKLDLGSLVFFEDYVITEFKEGIHITYDNFAESRALIKSIYKDRPFGFIANRKHTYSINLTDATNFNTSFPNLKAYAVVSNTMFGKGIFEIENQFFKYNRKIFKDLESAKIWVKEALDKEKQLH